MWIPFWNIKLFHSSKIWTKSLSIFCDQSSFILVMSPMITRQRRIPLKGFMILHSTLKKKRWTNPKKGNFIKVTWGWRGILIWLRIILWTRHQGPLMRRRQILARLIITSSLFLSILSMNLFSTFCFLPAPASLRITRHGLLAQTEAHSPDPPSSDPLWTRAQAPPAPDLPAEQSAANKKVETF